MSTQPKPSNVWLEPVPESATLPTPLRVQHDGTDWILSATGEPDAVFVDWQGFGDYELLDLRTEYFLVYDGSDFTLSTTGSAVAILVDDGDGDDHPEISTTLTAEPIARFVTDLTGDIVLYRDASPELQLLQVGSDVLCYQDN